MYGDWVKYCDRSDINEDVWFGQSYHVVIIVHREGMIMPHNKEPPRNHPDIRSSKRRAFPKKKKLDYQSSAYLVCEADAEMWHNFTSPLANQGGEEIEISHYVGFYSDADPDDGDASTFSEHAESDEGDASTFSEHTVYSSLWNTGTSKLRRPTTSVVSKCKNMLRRSGCGRLLMEISQERSSSRLLQPVQAGHAVHRLTSSTTVST